MTDFDKEFTRQFGNQPVLFGQIFQCKQCECLWENGVNSVVSILCSNCTSKNQSIRDKK